MTSLYEVAKFLKKKQCYQSMKTGSCGHPACQEAREARDIVLVAADLLEPASEPKLAEGTTPLPSAQAS